MFVASSSRMRTDNTEPPSMSARVWKVEITPKQAQKVRLQFSHVCALFIDVRAREQLFGVIGTLCIDSLEVVET